LPPGISGCHYPLRVGSHDCRRPLQRPKRKSAFPGRTLFDSLSEAILANVIACEVAGIPRAQIKMIVGPDGGTVIGEGMVFQTPVTTRLTEEHGRLLFQTFGKLHAEYEGNRLSAARLAQIRARHNVDHKLQAIRNARNP